MKSLRAAIRKGNWKLVHYYEDDRVELYNLADDPAEQHDLADAKPGKAKELRAQLDAWRKETDANAPVPNPARR